MSIILGCALFLVFVIQNRKEQLLGGNAVRYSVAWLVLLVPSNVMARIMVFNWERL